MCARYSQGNVADQQMHTKLQALAHDLFPCKRCIRTSSIDECHARKMQCVSMSVLCLTSGFRSFYIVSHVRTGHTTHVQENLLDQQCSILLSDRYTKSVFKNCLHSKM